MKTLEITTIDALKSLDLKQFEVGESVHIDIKLRLVDEEIDYPVSIIHRHPGFESKLSVKLALFGRSKVNMPVEISVCKGARDTATDFKATVYLMSPEAKATVTPGLMIEEKNIFAASHGVVIKNIKDKDLYYLRSRGMSRDDAKEMMVPF